MEIFKIHKSKRIFRHEKKRKTTKWKIFNKTPHIKLKTSK